MIAAAGWIALTFLILALAVWIGVKLERRRTEAQRYEMLKRPRVVPIIYDRYGQEVELYDDLEDRKRRNDG